MAYNRFSIGCERAIEMKARRENYGFRFRDVWPRVAVD